MNNQRQINGFEKTCPNSCNDEIAENLKKIVVLQKAAVREELSEKMCDADFLGDEKDCKVCDFNTRPLQLFTHEDKSWECPVERDADGCNDCGSDTKRTCVFRVEKVEDATATFRALIDTHEYKYEKNEEYDYNHRNKRERFKATDSYITIKLVDIAALRCLKDCFVDICIRNI